MENKIRLSNLEKEQCKRVLLQNIKSNKVVLNDRAFMDKAGLEFIESAYRLMKAYKYENRGLIVEYHKIMMNKLKRIQLHFDLELIDSVVNGNYIEFIFKAAPYDKECTLRIT